MNALTAMVLNSLGWSQHFLEDAKMWLVRNFRGSLRWLTVANLRQRQRTLGLYEKHQVLVEFADILHRKEDVLTQQGEALLRHERGISTMLKIWDLGNGTGRRVGRIWLRCLTG